MKKEELRRVLYTLESSNSYGYLDYDNDDAQGIATEEKEGLFHRWADEVITENEKTFMNTYGLVENIKTGQIEEVVPKRIRFQTQYESR